MPNPLELPVELLCLTSQKLRAIAQAVLHTSMHVGIGRENPLYHIWLFNRTILSRAKLALAAKELNTQHILTKQVLFVSVLRI